MKGRVEHEVCSSGDKEDSRTAPNASIWEGCEAPKLSLPPLKMPPPTPSPGVVAGSCCPLRSLPGQLHRRRLGWAAPGPGCGRGRARRPGSATAPQQSRGTAAAGTGGAGQLEPGRHHQAAAAPAQRHLPGKQTGLFPAGSERGRVAGREPRL